MSSNTDYIQNVAITIIKQLAEGTAPWVKPWQSGERFMPYNASTGKNYQGVNSLWLMAVSQFKGYQDPRWLTFKQSQSLDTRVNQGEKGSMVQFWQWTLKEHLLDNVGKPLLDSDGNPQSRLVQLERPRVRSAVVFNAEQISNLPPAEIRPALSEWDRHETAERILNASQASIRYLPGDDAYYASQTDRITLPERSQFSSADGFYATALHELGHWTGHPTRLNRDLNHPYGSEGYAKEELRAEIASMMLGEQLSIGYDPGKHVAYIKSWIRVLENDPRELFRATSDSEKIVQHLRGYELVQTQTLEADNAIQVVMPNLASTQEKNEMNICHERVYLTVPYKEKDEAKSLGAQWDKSAKSWYVPAGTNLDGFHSWLPASSNTTHEITQDPRAEFARVLRDAGLILDGLPVLDGEMRRVRVEGDKLGQNSGAYKGFDDGHPAGFYQNYKTGMKSNWKSSAKAKTLSALDFARLQAEAAQKQQDRAIAREHQYEQSAHHAQAYWEAATPVTEHPYLSEKGVLSYGLRQDENGDLLIPMRDTDGKIWSTQRVNAHGRKSFAKDSRMQDLFFMIGDPESCQRMMVAEGYATGATLHHATGLPVAICFNSGNMPSVAQALKARYPDNTFYLAGDNDHHLEAKGKPNVGLIKAQEAASLTQGVLLIPSFAPGDSGTDWNDVFNRGGLDTLHHELQKAKIIGEREKRLSEIVLKSEAQESRNQHERAQDQEEQQPEKALALAGGRNIQIEI